LNLDKKATWLSRSNQYCWFFSPAKISNNAQNIYSDTENIVGFDTWEENSVISFSEITEHDKKNNLDTTSILLSYYVNSVHSVSYLGNATEQRRYYYSIVVKMW
jgi:hypothetical protein